MKYCLLLTLFTGISFAVSAQDLPSRPSNLQTLPKGSYIIAMDNTNQLNGALFNLKAYGLVTYLLNKGTKLKWVITAGKAKDGVDFTVNTTQVRPTVSGTVTSRSFSGGPFVIYATDTTGVAALIDGFYTSAAITGTAQPNVFVSKQAVTVDIRYDMSGFVPLAAVLNDGGNAAIHTAFMTAASIPASNYYTSTGTAFQTSCATFASEPHNDLKASTQSKIDAIVKNLRAFTQAGGNFLAQCAAVLYYENSVNGYFQSTGGVTVTNLTINTNDSFPNPDLSFSQFVGVYDMNLTGSVLSWTVNGTTVNSQHGHVLGKAPNQTSVAASVSKMRSGTGGLVFYLGSHTFSTATSGPGAADQQNINGVRMYLNAFLTPAIQVCNAILPVRLEDFQGTQANGMISLKWVVDQNEDLRSFEVESSENGTTFISEAEVAARASSGEARYQYALPAVTRGAFYRLRLMEKTGKLSYSRVLHFASGEAPQGTLKIEQNPVHSELRLQFQATKAASYTIVLVNAQGACVYRRKVAMSEGSNVLALELSEQLPRGLLILQLQGEQGLYQAKLIKN